MKSNKKGFTLVELVIVIVLLGIISLMFVTFSKLSSQHTVSITNKNKVFTDVSIMTELYNDWIALFDNNEYSFYIVTTKQEILREDAEEKEVVNTDVLYAFKNSDYLEYKTNNSLTEDDYLGFVTSTAYATKVYRFYIRQDGIVIGTNPDGELIFSGTLKVLSLKFSIEQNPNNNNVLLVKLTLNYSYMNMATKKYVYQTMDFYKATKSNVGYAGTVDTSNSGGGSGE